MLRRLLLPLALVAAACTPEVPPEPLTLGAVVPSGQPEQAVRLAVEQVNQAGGVNGQPVELEVVAPSAIERPGTPVIVLHPEGPSPADLAAGGSVVISTGVAPWPPSPTQRVFHLRSSPGREGAALADLVAEEGRLSVTVVVASEDRTVADAFIARLEQVGGEVLLVEELPSGSDPAGLTPLLERLAEAQPRAVVCVCSAEQGAAVLREAFVLGILGRPWYHAGGMRQADVPSAVFPEDPGRLAGQKGVALQEPSSSWFDEFAQAFTERYGTTPGPEGALAYDAALLAILAAQAGGLSGIAEQLSEVSRGGAPCRGTECLAAAREGRDVDYQGASGPVDLGSDGFPSPAAVQIWRYTLEGTIEVIEVRSYPS